MTGLQQVGTRPAVAMGLEPTSPRSWCAGLVGTPDVVDYRGTLFKSPLMLAIWHGLSVQNQFPQASMTGSWDTLLGGALHSYIRCSATLDYLERPSTLEYFTPSTSEWITDFEFMTPPTFIGHEGPAQGRRKKTQNVGYETVTWLRDFLACSQERASRYARVPLATFYRWRTHPQSVVRPASIADGLRLRASLELAQRSIGREATIRELTSGHPSKLDALAGDEREWRRAVDQISALGQPEIRDASEPVNTVADYLEQLNQLDGDTSGADGEIVLGAEKMTEEQTREIADWA